MIVLPELCISSTCTRIHNYIIQNVFHQGIHCLLRLKQSSGTEIHHNLENSTFGPLKYTISSPILMESICMEKSTRIQILQIVL